MYGSRKNGAADNPLLEGEERHFFKKMKEILEDFPNKGPPSVPSQLLPHLYIGSLRNAEDINMLERLNISHVLNVAGTRKFDLTKSPYPKDLGIKEYLMIPAEDHDCYNIVQHFFEANAFINRAKRVGGKALVHCNLGVNRCGALCTAYLLIEERLPLLEVVAFMKKKRGVVLCNKGFRRQILRYAMARGLIEGANNGNMYGSLGTISKYLSSTRSGKSETDRQKERIRESEMARKREQERQSMRHATSNGAPVVNGTAHTNGNGTGNNGNKKQVNGRNGNGNGNGNGNCHNGNANGENGEKFAEGSECNGTSENGSESLNGGDVSEEDEEVANLVNQQPKISRFLPRNSTIYSPEPTNNEEPRSFSKRYQRSYTADLGTRSYSPTVEFGTTFGRTPSRNLSPSQRSYSADISLESQRDRCMSPNDSAAPDDEETSMKSRSNGRRVHGDERPSTVCGDYATGNSKRYSASNRYSRKPIPEDISDDELDSEYTPMINVFHLEHLDKEGFKHSPRYQPMSFSSENVSEPTLLEKNAKLSSYVHVRPYAPSLEFVGRKTVTSGTSYSTGHYSTKKYGSDSRPHSVYTDRPYSANSVPDSRYSTSTRTGSRPLSTYRSTTYKGYSPQILPTTSTTGTNRPYTSFNSSSSYKRGPISSAIMRHSRSLSSSISDYTRSYSDLLH